MIDIDISYIDTLYSILILLTSLLFTNCIYLLYSHVSFHNYISFTRLFDNNFSYNLLKYSFDINTRLFMFLHNCNIQYLMQDQIEKKAKSQDPWHLILLKRLQLHLVL